MQFDVSLLNGVMLPQDAFSKRARLSSQYDIKPAKDAEVQQIRVFLPSAPEEASDSATNTSDDETELKLKRNLQAVRKPITSAFHVVSGFAQSLLPESETADERIQPVTLGYRAPVEQTKTATYKLKPIGFGSPGPVTLDVSRADDKSNGKREHKKKKDRSKS
jgi:hypothetical protein